MDARIEQILVQISEELNELRKTVGADFLVLQTAIKAALPYLSNDARIAIDRELRRLSETAQKDNPDLEWVRLQLGPLEMGALLPIHRPGWNGIPDPPT